MEERFLVQIENAEYDIVVRHDGEAYVATVNGVPQNITLSDSRSEDGNVHALIGSRSHQVNLTRNNGSWNVFVSGKEYQAKVANYRLAQLKTRLGVKETKSMSRVLKSPMPGLVLQVNVAQGDTVEQGDTLLVLEAMKMENPIKSSGAGVVSKVHVAPKDSVEKGAALIEFAD